MMTRSLPFDTRFTAKLRSVMAAGDVTRVPMMGIVIVTDRDDLPDVGRDGDGMTTRVAERRDRSCRRRTPKPSAPRLRAVRIAAAPVPARRGAQVRRQWKAVVVGSYERGDRAVSVPAARPSWPTSTASRSATCCRPTTAPFARRVVRHRRCRGCAEPRQRSASLTDGHADILRRFVSSIQRQRGNVGSAHAAGAARGPQHASALMYDTTVDGSPTSLVRWQVLAPESVIVDSEL